MDIMSRKGERRSLLPQKSTRSQPLATSKTSSQKSRYELTERLNTSRQLGDANGSIGSSAPSAQAGSPPADTTDGDTENPKSRKQVGRMQAPTNVGRSLSTKSQSEHLGKIRFTQRAPSIEPKDQPAAIPRIAIPQPIIEDSPSLEMVKAEPSVAPRAIPTPKKLVLDSPNRRIAQESEQRKASTARPNIAVSRHNRTNSQQTSSKKPSDEFRPASSDPAPKSQRPAFSTLQQHFTPRKASKASTSSLLAPPLSNPATDTTLTPSSLHLQTQLAQLHLLHRSSATTHSQWEASAKTHFKRELQNLSTQEGELQRLERDHHAAINYPALAAWCHSAPSAEFAERIQILSRTLQEISGLLEGGSKYERVIGVFEAWFAGAQRVRNSRCGPSREEEAEMEFVEDIGEGWKADVAYWERKLMASARELQQLGEAREGSSIARVVALLRGTVDGMVEELAAVKAIERDVVVAEARWVEEEVAKIAWDVGDDAAALDSLTRHGIWHEKGMG